MFNFFSSKKYRLGVALGGGGARGFAHAGALRAMEQCGLRPDVIAGVSAGAIIACMYSAGISPEKILTLFDGESFGSFCEWHIPRGGLLTLEGFKGFLRRSIPFENLEDLPIPVVLGATDLDAGTTVHFRSGPIADRVAASCSIPIVFQPQEIDGRRYVDGGVLHNLPAQPIRDDCRYLIGINVSPLRQRRVNNSLFDTAMRSYELVTKTNSRPDIALCDLVARMDDIADYNVFNLREARRVFQVGYMTMMDELRGAGLTPRKL
ncbi:MAG: patatin-like phospholipase family protein [Clostridium sp.]|nr:patatin-like phospholipase family protein [Clostridium sp.]